MTLPPELERLLRPLTPRQREVLELAVLEGLTHQAIAVRLGIGRQSVKNHMMAIYDKLCPLRRDLFLAAIEAWRRGEITLPQPASQRSSYHEW
jgi:DNA-binding NarL/FixJ family response regulator